MWVRQVSRDRGRGRDRDRGRGRGRDRDRGRGRGRGTIDEAEVKQLRQGSQKTMQMYSIKFMRQHTHLTRLTCI